MEQNENSESRDHSGFDPSGRHWWEEWDGQDSSVPEPPWEPDAIDLLLHPELAGGRTGEDGAEDAEQGESRFERPGSASLPPPAPDPDEATPPAAPDCAGAPPPVPAKAWGTGFYYRNGAEIPPTHPDHGPMHLIPRQHDGSFAAYYYCSKADLANMENPAPPPRRYRRDGFSPERQEEFVRHLRGTASWTDAARLTGISRSTAYNLYNEPAAAGFRAAVDEALNATQGLLEATALERAIKGQEEIVYYKGRRVGVRWKPDNRLLMSLLRARNPLRYAPLNEIEGWLRRRGLEPPPDLEGALDRLHSAEAEWGRRLPGEGEPPALLPASPESAGPALGPPPAPALEAPASPPASGPRHASTSSTLASEQSRQAPALSTSGAESPVRASSLSTSHGETPLQSSTSSSSADAAVPEPGVPRLVRPPPRPRIRLA